MLFIKQHKPQSNLLIVERYKMNICIIPSAELSYESGSTLYAQNCINSLADLGHNIYVICSKLPRKTHRKVHYKLVDIMEHPVIDDYFITDFRMWDSINRITKTVLDINNETPIDLIHAHYATINSVAAINVKQLKGIPYVVSCFGRDVFNGFDNDKRYAKMVPQSLNNADYIIASNAAVESRILQLLNKNISVPVISLNMPIDTKTFFPKNDTSIRKGSLHILNVVSCFSEEKGILTTLQAIEKINNWGYEVSLHILGGDENPVQKNYKKYIEVIEKNNMSNVHFEGMVTNDEVAKWLRKTDILVDSRYVGNFSSVILEALATGIPVIASNAPGNTELIQDNFNGLLYTKGDSAELAEKLVELIVSDKKPRKLSLGALTWFEKNRYRYCLEDHIIQLEKIYSSIIRQ